MLFPVIEPDWLADETLFSLCARIAHLSCSAGSDTARMLFGSARIGFQHDFPTGLTALVQRSAGRWGSVDELIERHTVLPYFLPLRDREFAANAYAAMAGMSGGMLKSQLGMQSSRLRALHPLKACPQCMKVDRERHHVAYWHLTHQYPGVWVCLEHGVHLVESMIDASAVRRLGWQLPDDGAFREQHPHLALFEGELPQPLKRLAIDAVQLARLPRGFHLNPQALAETYRRRVRDRGYMHGNRFAWDPLSREYLRHVAPLHAADPRRGLPGELAQSRGELERLLRVQHFGTHPIRHLAFIGWLFKDWIEFLTAYEGVAAELDSKSTSPAIRIAPPIDHRIAQFVSIMRTGEHTLSQAARMVGADIGTAMAWMEKHGIAAGWRSKLPSPKRRPELEAALRDGVDKTSASLQFDVSVATVTTTLYATPGLYLAWQDARACRRRNERRHEWQQLIAQTPGASLKRLRDFAPACYKWLHRNDRAWFDEANAHLPPSERGGDSHVAWDVQDRLLAAEVERLGAALADQFQGKPIPTWLLCQKLPELKAKIGQLGRWPLTQNALLILTRRRRAPSARSSSLL